MFNINDFSVGGDFIGFLLLVIAFIIWVLKTERCFNERVDKRVEKKIGIHSLEKKVILENHDMRIKNNELMIKETLKTLSELVKSSQNVEKDVAVIKTDVKNIKGS